MLKGSKIFNFNLKYYESKWYYSAGLLDPEDTQINNLLVQVLCDLYKVLSSSKYEEVTQEIKEEKEDVLKRMTFQSVRPGRNAELPKISNIIWEKDEISAGYALQKLSEVGNETLLLII